MFPLFELVKVLSETAGPPGLEERVAKIINGELAVLNGETSSDSFGNVIFRVPAKRKNNRKIMFTAHMDEIAFMVEHIEPNGLLKFVNLGMIDDSLLRSSHYVTVLGKKDIPGIIPSVPPHFKSKMQNEEPFIDTGLRSYEEVVEAGISVGTPVVFQSSFREWQNKKYISGKALDDRVGCAVLIEMLKRLLGNSRVSSDIYVVFTTQEEVGLRGAMVAVGNIKPDIAITVDMVPAFPSQKSRIDISKGPVLRLLEQEGWFGLIAFKKVLNLLENAANKSNVSLQHLVRPFGMTDASTIHLTCQGIPSCSIEIPCRYEHSPAELVFWEDILKMVDVLTKVCEIV